MDEPLEQTIHTLADDIESEGLILPENDIGRRTARLEAGIGLFGEILEADPRYLFENFREALAAVASWREIGPQIVRLLQSDHELGISGGFSRSGKSVTAQMMCEFIRRSGGNALVIDMQGVGTCPAEQTLFSVLYHIADAADSFDVVDRPLDFLVIDEAGVLNGTASKHGYGLPELLMHLRHYYPVTKIMSVTVFFRNWRMQEPTTGDLSQYMPRHFMEPQMERLQGYGSGAAGIELKDCWSLDTFQLALAAFAERNCSEADVSACARELFATAAGNGLIWKTIIDIARGAENGAPLLTARQLAELTVRFQRINAQRSTLSNPLDYDGIQRILTENGFPAREAEKIAKAIKWAFSGYPSPLYTAKTVSSSLGHSSSVTPDLSILGRGPEQGFFGK